jgi:hypothetical protein
MMPSIIYETLAADSTLTAMLSTFNGGPAIIELQSVDERPVADGYFIIIDMQETYVQFQDHIGPRTMQIWVHNPLDDNRDYGQITKIFNRIDAILLPIINETGEDGCRCSQVFRHGRSRNTYDPAWKTTTRNALYTVAYDESAA